GLGRDVERIDLAHNSIASLAGEDTAGLAHLEHLDLSSNQLQAVAERAMESLVRLRSLRLAANRLARHHLANGRAFRALGRLEVTWLSGGLFRGVPRLRELNLKNNGLVAIEEGALEGLRDLRVLDLALNSLRCVSGFRLPQVRVLNLSYNALESFAAGGEARAAPQLRTLDLSHNRLASLPLLPRGTGLRSLNLSHNAIAHVDANTTQAEHPSPWAARQAGPGVSWSGGDAAVGLATTVALDLSSNQLSALPVSLLRSLTSLHTLSLAENCLQGVAVGQPPWGPLPGPAAGGKEPAGALSVRELDLHGNRVRSLPRDFFNLMPRLERVDLGFNCVQLCSASKSGGPSEGGSGCTAFRHAPRLRHLSLRRNQLAVVPGRLFLQTPLSSLDLSENEGLVLPEGALAGLGASLRTLSLSGNQMPAGDLHFPCGLGGLKTLDLAGNRLSRLPPGLLCSPLEELDLRQNRLRGLDEATGAKLARSLRRLALAGNPFRCCELGGLEVLLGTAAVTVRDSEDARCSYYDGQENVTARIRPRQAWPCPQRLRRDYWIALAGVAGGLLCALCLACTACYLRKKGKGSLLLDLGRSRKVHPDRSELAASGQSSVDTSTKV
ncbi:hypothetical protein lerEdw1_010311, partial [Lerista edwardsae]